MIFFGVTTEEGGFTTDGYSVVSNGLFERFDPPDSRVGDRVVMRVENRMPAASGKADMCDTTVMFCVIRSFATAKEKQDAFNACEASGKYAFDYEDTQSGPFALRIPLGASYAVADFTARVAQLLQPCVVSDASDAVELIGVHHRGADDTQQPWGSPEFYTKGSQLLTERDMEERWLRSHGGVNDPCNIAGDWEGRHESMPDATFRLSISVEQREQTAVFLDLRAKVINNIFRGAEGRAETGKGVIITKVKPGRSTLMGSSPEWMQLESTVSGMIGSAQMFSLVSRTELSLTYSQQGNPTTMILTRENPRTQDPRRNDGPRGKTRVPYNTSCSDDPEYLAKHWNEFENKLLGQ